VTIDSLDEDWLTIDYIVVVCREFQGNDHCAVMQFLEEKNRITKMDRK
jgi:hypothetical protein